MDKQEGGAPPQEIKENPSPFNLLTNFEETMWAIAEIEGQNWLIRQTRETPNGQNINGALEQLKKWPDQAVDPELKDTILTTVYGDDGGGRRWGITFSGEVKFSGFHIAPSLQGQAQLEKAKALGFRVF